MVVGVVGGAAGAPVVSDGRPGARLAATTADGWRAALVSQAAKSAGRTVVATTSTAARPAVALRRVGTSLDFPFRVASVVALAPPLRRRSGGSDASCSTCHSLVAVPSVRARGGRWADQAIPHCWFYRRPCRPCSQRCGSSRVPAVDVGAVGIVAPVRHRWRYLQRRNLPAGLFLNQVRGHGLGRVELASFSLVCSPLDGCRDRHVVAPVVRRVARPLLRMGLVSWPLPGCPRGHWPAWLRCSPAFCSTR